MKGPDFSQLDLNICRARVVLSLVALLSIYIDPTKGGAFTLDRYILTTLLLHLAYSVAAYVAVSRLKSQRLPVLTIGFDVLFATAVAVFTEGPTSPSYVFFTFAIIAVGCRSGLRATLKVTFLSVAVYSLLILLTPEHMQNLYVMRPAYLAITGCLIGFLGQQRANFEVRIRELETITERQAIARSLHDGYVQALAGVNLRLETCRELISRNRSAEAFGHLTELQIGVAREYDEVRSYIHSLVDSDRKRAPESFAHGYGPRFNIHADFAARGLLVEHVLQIVLEGMRNARRHAKANSATVDVHEADGMIRITIEDDGIGFSESEAPPWAIASRVAEFGGRLQMASSHSGAHLEIEMPIS